MIPFLGGTTAAKLAHDLVGTALIWLKLAHLCPPLDLALCIMADEAACAADLTSQRVSKAARRRERIEAMLNDQQSKKRGKPVPGAGSKSPAVTPEPKIAKRGSSGSLETSTTAASPDQAPVAPRLLDFAGVTICVHAY